MGHDHHHDHAHIQPSKELFEKKGFVITVGILLNLLFVIAEFSYGYISHSLAMLSDAGHNLGDVSGLFLALLAYLLSKRKPDQNFHFGWKRVTISVSLFNSLFLLFTILFICKEGIERLQNPEKVEGLGIILFAFLGILVNGFSAYLFLGHKDNDLNLKTAYYHLIVDAVISVSVFFSGTIIYFTNLYWIDPLISIIVVLAILPSAIKVFRESLKISLDGIPSSLDLNKIQKEISSVPGILKIQNIKIRALSTEENSLSAILEISPDLQAIEINNLIKETKHKLLHLDISESYLEICFPKTKSGL